MTQQDIITGCNLLVISNKGISLSEEYLLQQIPKLRLQGHAKRLNNIEK